MKLAPTPFSLHSGTFDTNFVRFEEGGGNFTQVEKVQYPLSLERDVFYVLAKLVMKTTLKWFVYMSTSPHLDV